jgi:hypothetical protein
VIWAIETNQEVEKLKTRKSKKITFSTRIILPVSFCRLQKECYETTRIYVAKTSRLAGKIP